MTTETLKDNEQKKPEFVIQRIYTKDISFESPRSPQLFTENWTPEVKMELSTDTKVISETLYEVLLKVTVTVQKEETVGFLIEVVQAGLFTLKNFPTPQLGPMLGSFCPNILFPYAREMVSNLAAHGGFPALYLSPVNFETLYAQHLQKLQAKTPASPEIII